MVDICAARALEVIFGLSFGGLRQGRARLPRLAGIFSCAVCGEFVDWYADIVVRVDQLLRENEIVETVKLEITSAVNEALKSREEEIVETGLLEGISIEVVSKLTGLSTIEVQNIANRLGLDK